MKDIDEIIRKTDKTVGFFNSKHMRMLFPIVGNLPSAGLIVEIGTYLGKSTKFFSLVNEKIRILTIDLSYFPDVPKRKGVVISRDVLMNGNIFQVLGDSSKVVKGFNWKIDLLFIDGSHLYEDVRKDILNWIPLIKVGGYVVFHDYEETHMGVVQAVDEWANDTGFEKISDDFGLFIAKRSK